MFVYFCPLDSTKRSNTKFLTTYSFSNNKIFCKNVPMKKNIYLPCKSTENPERPWSSFRTRSHFTDSLSISNITVTFKAFSIIKAFALSFYLGVYFVEAELWQICGIIRETSDIKYGVIGVKISKFPGRAGPARATWRENPISLFSADSFSRVISGTVFWQRAH